MARPVAIGEDIESNLSKNEVHIWLVNVNDQFVAFNYYLSLLSLEEKEQAKNYIFHKHSNNFIIRRAILRIILSFYLNVPPKDILISIDKNGKPYLNYSELNVFFNLSHSSDLVYYAISSESYMGIDIEYIQDLDLEKDLLTLVLHSEEYIFFEGLFSHQKRDFFYRYWTQKEALVKAVGSGLSHPLSNIHIDFSDYLSPSLVRFDQKENTNNWSLALLKTPSNYVAHIALNGVMNSIKYKRFINNEYT